MAFSRRLAKLQPSSPDTGLTDKAETAARGAGETAATGSGTDRGLAGNAKGTDKGDIKATCTDRGMAPADWSRLSDPPPRLAGSFVDVESREKAEGFSHRAEPKLERSSGFGWDGAGFSARGKDACGVASNAGAAKFPEQDQVSALRGQPCPSGCGFMITWHRSHCCGKCKGFPGAHGPRCERQPVGLPGGRMGYSGGSSMPGMASAAVEVEIGGRPFLLVGDMLIDAQTQEIAFRCDSKGNLFDVQTGEPMGNVSGDDAPIILEPGGGIGSSSARKGAKETLSAEGWAERGRALLADDFVHQAAAAFGEALAACVEERAVELDFECELLRSRAECFRRLQDFEALLENAEKLLAYDDADAQAKEWKKLALEGVVRTNSMRR